MINFLYGRIIVNDPTQKIASRLDFYMMHFCIKNNFALSFVDRLPTKHTVEDILFRISDSFLIEYCESFMEPVIYSHGVPQIENLLNDLDKLYGLINLIMNFKFVDKVELRFSYAEVDECEYSVCETSVEQMKDIILEQYLSTIGFPVINVVIEK